MPANFVRNMSIAQILNRMLVTTFGSYAFCWGLISLCEVGLTGLGMSFHDAVHLANMLAILAYLAAFLWTFVAQSLVWTWLMLAGSGGAMAVLASLLQAQLVA